MKKTIFLALISIFLLSSLIGCGGGASSSSTPPGEQPSVAFLIELRPSQYIAQTNSFIIIRARVLNGNGNPIANVPVRFTNLSAVGQLSATTANTNNSGFAEIRLASTTAGFATIQAEIYSGESVVRDRRTVFFTLQNILAVRLALDVDANNNLIYDEPSDLLLGEDANDNSVKIRARVFDAGGVLLAGRQVTFDAERAFRVGTSILGTDAWPCSDGSDTCFIAFPLGTTAFTSVDTGEAFVQVLVAAESLRNFTTNLNIFAFADNGAANMKTLFISPVAVSAVAVSADPSVIPPSTSGTPSPSTITAIAVTNLNQPVPDGTTINFSIDAVCAAAGGTITPFGRTGVAAPGDGTATATFTAPPKEGKCTVTASVGGKSATVDVLVTTPLTVQPTAQTIDGVVGGKAIFTIYGGIPGYTVTSSNKAIACNSTDADCSDASDTGTWAVAASGDTFTVTVPANTPSGSVTLTVRDSVGTTVPATITITGPGGLMIVPGSVSVIAGTGGEFTFTISGGTPPYTTTSSNPAKACNSTDNICDATDTGTWTGTPITVTVPATATPGTVTLNVFDAAGGKTSATITIACAISPVISPISATICENDTSCSAGRDSVSFSIFDGTPPYFTISSNPGVIASPGALATFSVNAINNTITADTTVTLTVTDSSVVCPATATATVTVINQ